MNLPPYVTPELLELSLLVMYLSRIEFDVPKKTGKKQIKAWKGHMLEVIEALKEQGLIKDLRSIKMVLLTDEGIKKAEQLKNKYLCA